MSRADWVSDAQLCHILAALTPANRLALQVARKTGLRIGDVLSLRTAQVEKGQRVTVREQKTGKTRRVYLPAALRLEMLGQAGRLWVFEGRTDWRKHRSRAAVYKDLVRVAKAFKVGGLVARSQSVTPHSTRKAYAVERLSATGSLAAVQRELNHADKETTLLYAMADELTKRKVEKHGKGTIGRTGRGTGNAGAGGGTSKGQRVYRG